MSFSPSIFLCILSLVSPISNPASFNALSLIYRVKGSGDEFVKIFSKIYTIGLTQFTVFENVFSSDFYADVLGRADSVNDGFVYTGTSPAGGESKVLIEKPVDIFYHFFEKELGHINSTDYASISTARVNNITPNKFAFSINEKINSKKLLNEMSKSACFFPTFSRLNRTSGKQELSFLSFTKFIPPINQEIKSKDVISYSYEKTPIENVYTLVNVKYKKDYATDDYTRETGWIDAFDYFGNGEWIPTTYSPPNPEKRFGYSYENLGLKREDNILNFESDFIRDHESALMLRDYLLSFNANPHLIIKAKLPLKYINLEVGDIVEFDKLIDNNLAFGKDYSIEGSDYTKWNVANNTILGEVVNGQVVQPYFHIFSVKRTLKSIDIEALQYHVLERPFRPGLGSLTRKSSRGISPSMPDDQFNISDFTAQDDEYQTSETNYWFNITQIVNYNHLF